MSKDNAPTDSSTKLPLDEAAQKQKDLDKALLKSALENNTEITKMLLKQGANPNAKYSRSISSPLCRL